MMTASVIKLAVFVLIEQTLRIQYAFYFMSQRKLKVVWKESGAVGSVVNDTRSVKWVNIVDIFRTIEE